MIKQVVFILMSSLLLVSCQTRPLLLNVKNASVTNQKEQVVFNSALWQGSGATTRGKMLKSLFEQQTFEMKDRGFVVELLGKGDCYHDYDDEPCYSIEYERKTYFLGFGLNHSDHPGKVMSIELQQIK